jgi:hypothetical protein
MQYWLFPSRVGLLVALLAGLSGACTSARVADPADLVATGTAVTTTTARPAYGAVVVANDGELSYVVESRRDVEPGPFGLPWRSRFRLAAYDSGELTWTHAIDADDTIGDVVVHPSGDVTFSLQRHPPIRRAYELVRLDRDGHEIGRTVLEEPSTLPDADFGPNDPRPLFRMKSEFGDALTAGWVRLLPDGEDLVVTILSFSDAPPSDPRTTRLVLGLVTYDWHDGAYLERWGRVVEGLHGADPAAWAYDELRWTEQAVRPFLARDDSTGDLLVGRAWNNTRCQANLATFAEFTATQCVFDTVSTNENERLPLAVTRFDASGQRVGTIVLAPDADAAEQLPFALAARDGRLAVVGSVVRMLDDGSKRSYPESGAFVDYDGYLAIFDAQGRREQSHDVNLGRGDVLAAMRWTRQGIVAVGASGWDRWQGGMSIGRGCDPVFVWLADDAEPVSRVIPLSDTTRHWNLHDVVVHERAIIGYGLSDAPMTHSADGANHEARTFGSLQIRLETP